MSSASSGPFVVRRVRAAVYVISHARAHARGSQRTSSSLVARGSSAMASSGWNLHRVYGLSWLRRLSSALRCSAALEDIAGIAQSRPLLPAPNDSTNFSYAPRPWARRRLKGERPIDSKPSVSFLSPPTLSPTSLLLYPSLLSSPLRVLIISRP
jgi:hypothetical protein